MNYEKKKLKLRIVMICHFSNAYVRSQLPLDNRRLYAFARLLLHMPKKILSYGDIAPWDSNIIEGLSERTDVELHVISAHSGLKRRVVSFCKDHVDYSFVRCDDSTFLKRIIPSPNIWLRLNPVRKRVKKIVDNINPDIVLLFGAENAYISSAILDLGKYPRMVMCQTVYNNPRRKDFGRVDKYNAYVERRIISENKYFSFISDMHRDMLLKIRSDIYAFHWEASTPLPSVKPIEVKKYDFVNFALNMCFNKGFHDSLKALAIVKKQYPSVRMNITGGCTSDIREELLSLIDTLNLKENVDITPFFEKQEDLFQHLQQSRFAVLPCKMDYIAGTMAQCMHYGLPLVVYETNGTPTLNAEGECVLIAKHSDIEDLANKMMLLLQYPEEAAQMAERAKKFSERFSDRKKVVEEIIRACLAVLEKEKEGKDIPQDIIFKSK